MNKRTVWFAGIFIVLLVCCVIYFYPISLSHYINENNYFIVQISEFGVQNGEACIDSTDYNNITKEQKETIISLFENYPCRRTLGTYISDGSIHGLGNMLVSIYIYNDKTLTKSILVSSSGQITVDGRLYIMKNTEQFIKQIADILNY